MWTKAFFGELRWDSLLNTHIEEVDNPEKAISYVAKYIIKGEERNAGNNDGFDLTTYTT